MGIRRTNFLVIKVNVPPDTNKGEIYGNVVQDYKYALGVVEEKYQAIVQNREIEVREEKIADCRKQIADYRRQNTDILQSINKLADKQFTPAGTNFMNIDKIQNIKVGRDATGSTLNIGEISGIVENEINQLPDTLTTTDLGLKELLTQLK